METDAILNLLLQFGTPGIIVTIVIILFRKYFPKALETYAKAKETEQKSFVDRQRQYQETSDKMIEVATQSNLIIDQNNQAMNRNSEIISKVVPALESFEKTQTNMIETLARQDKRAEEINIGIQKTLEHVRTVKQHED